MVLKFVVAQKIMNEVIKRKKDSGKKIEWRVLVVDHPSMRMISACCKMHEICEEGITLVEDLFKPRESLPMDAVYLLTPSKTSVEALIQDFKDPNNKMYNAAHVYFTEALPDDLFNELSRAKVAKFIKTLKEINISFVAYEQQVFSLDTPETFQCYYNPSRADSRVANMERIAEQMATLCATLGEYPSVRYRAEFKHNAELARIVQLKLDAYKVNEPTMGEGSEKARSQLLILDRGFDNVSPVVHELTFQAMAYDLLSIENDIYRYVTKSDHHEKEVLLDENDELWVDLRHEHIASVSQKVTKELKDFIESKRPIGNNQSAKDLSVMIKKMPQYHKDVEKYSKHLSLAEDCMKKFQGAIDKICKVEQDLATGLDTNSEVVKDHMRNIVPVVLDQSVNRSDVVRIVILYVLAKNGLSQADLDKVVQHSNLSPKQKQIILNLSHLGVKVINDDKDTEETGDEVPRKDRLGNHHYVTSRWVPIVKDIMEDCIADKLAVEEFPFQSNREISKGYIPVAAYSARYGHWHQNKKKRQPHIRHVPRLIVFIVGGVTYSEMRCAYEVTKSVENWEVIIGSSHILTPEDYLTNLANLSN